MKQKIQTIVTKVVSLKGKIPSDKWTLISSILIFVLLFNYLFSIEFRITPNQRLAKKTNNVNSDSGKPAQAVEQLTARQVTLPIKWNDFGKQMVDAGVIDKAKWEDALGTLSGEEIKLFSGANNSQIEMNEQNSRFVLDLLWAFGLANKNDVLDKGEMMQDPKQAGNFASTGGWSLSKDDPMNHYSKHNMLTLTPAQQEMVERMSKAIFRPCCNNSTHFPDCNHGMAMLGLLELMAANNVSEAEAYNVALKVNSIWFPVQYQEIAVYFAENGVSWDKVDAKEVLGPAFSSASGYRQTKTQIKSLPQPQQGGGGCGI